MPRIIIIPQVYPPETHPTAVMVKELAEYLAERDWDVTVCSGFPHHPYGRLYSGWTAKYFSITCEANVKVVRTGHFIHASRSMALRGAVFASQVLTSCAAASLQKKADLILVYGPPLLGGNIGGFVASIHRAAFVNVIYDIYPDIAIETGKIKHPLLIGAAKIAERTQYRLSDLTVVLSEGFRKTFMERGVPEEKIAVVPVWLDTNAIIPMERENSWRKEQGIPLDKFVVLYAGTIGVVSGAVLVAEVAARLIERTDILFVFVGEGGSRQPLMERAAELKLRNILFLPFQPRERLNEMQAVADVGLVTLAPGRGRTSVPSKVLGYMAAGRPVLASVDVDSDTAKLVKDNDFGNVISAGDSERLAEKVVSMADDRSRLKRLGSNARKSFEKLYSKETVLEKYEETLRNVLIRG